MPSTHRPPHGRTPARVNAPAAGTLRTRTLRTRSPRAAPPRREPPGRVHRSHPQRAVLARGGTPAPLRLRAAGLVLGLAADSLIGDPRRHHPVAWLGSWAQCVEARTYGDSRGQGVVHVVATLVPVIALGVGADALNRARPRAGILLTALATWACLGARSLAREGERMADALASDDLAGARQRLPHLCGRDPAALDAGELGRATVESLAENTADSAVATLWWGSVAGVPGMLLHRAINTLDAMVGHRSPRYRRFGTAAARLDDALDWIPARLTGALACALAPTVGGSTWNTARIWLRDARDHPSPNGGWCEAAWAGALGVRLGGENVYAGRVETRGNLGERDGPRPDADAVRAAARLVTRVTVCAALALTATLLMIDEFSPGRKHP